MGVLRMAASVLLAGALLVQGADPAITVDGSIGRVDVAYEELAAGRPEVAIARIKASKRLEIGDPAALINLGAAETMLGRKEVARGYYRAAMISTERYDLQLADGRWMDSRRAARLAESMLDGDKTTVR